VVGFDPVDDPRQSDLVPRRPSSRRRPEPKPASPFESIENSQEYVGLLAEVIQETRAAVEEEIRLATDDGAERRREALALVAYKLGQLQVHVNNSRRLLNDLRTLRRLLLAERSRQKDA
jgi:hypothetical protein